MVWSNLQTLFGLSITYGILLFQDVVQLVLKAFSANVLYRYFVLMLFLNRDRILIVR